MRELANLVERMAILYPHGIVGVNDLPEKFRNSDESMRPVDEFLDPDASLTSVSGSVLNTHDGLDQTMLPLSGIDLKAYLTNLEKDLISQALNYSDGVVARAAQRLHIRRTTLVEKMRKYQLMKKQNIEECKILNDNNHEAIMESEPSD